MKHKKIQMLGLVVLLMLFSVGTTLACDGLPEQVTQFVEELEQAGVTTDCTANQLVNWAVKNNSGNAVGDAMKLLNAYGVNTSRSIQIFNQRDIDAWRKKEGGIPKAFAAWKGNGAAVMYMPDKKEYVPIQYREYPKNETNGFQVKIIYDENSNFTDEDKAQIMEAVSWWKDRIKDNFQITLEFYLDPSISAGGTTLVGDVPRSCFDHQPGYAEIKLKTVNTSLVSHEVGHALGIGTATVFKTPNVCSMLALAAKDVPDLNLNSARIENGKFFGNNSKGVLLARDSDGSYGHVSSQMKDEDGNLSAVQPGLGGKPSLLDLRILEDLGYELK